MDWATLPKELLTSIFSLLSCTDLTSVVCVNSTWNTFANYDSVWKEAIFNSLPHHFSSSQKDVRWRQFAKKHLETKRNIIKNRCVQYTLGTRCATSKQYTTITLRNKTSNDKYCLITWDMVEMQGYSYQNTTHLGTELWDAETRTIVNKYSLAKLELFNEFIIQTNDLEFSGEHVTPYTTFDPYASDVELDKQISISTLNYGMVSVTRNEDPNSSLIALCNWTGEEKIIHVFDLRTGSKIFEKKYDDRTNIIILKFHGDKLVMRSVQGGSVRVVDVLQGKEVLLEEQASYATIAGTKLWAATHRGLIKYDILTKERTEYKISENMLAVTGMKVFDGLLWLHLNGTRLLLVDVSSSKPECQILGHITMPGWNTPEISQLSNGTYACLGTSYAHILSFRDEDLEAPIQVLQIETTGKNEILDMEHGDLNKTIAEKSQTMSILSQIVFEDQNQRYCIIYSYKDYEHSELPANQFVETAKKWIEKPEYHKTAIFQLVHFNSTQNRLIDPRSMSPVALGTAWVIYETKIAGAWQRGAPLDYWKFFKNKLRLT